MNIFWSEMDVLRLNWKKNPKPLRGRGGLYRIVERETGELLYVGQASNLGVRLAPSVHPIFDRGVHDVYVLFEADREERRQMEGLFIQLLRPSCNIRNGTMPKPPSKMTDEYYRQLFGQPPSLD